MMGEPSFEASCTGNNKGMLASAHEGFSRVVAGSLSLVSGGIKQLLFVHSFNKYFLGAFLDFLCIKGI